MGEICKKDFQNGKWAGYFLNGTFTDVTFQCLDQTLTSNIRAHKLVLAAASDVFEVMFFGSFSQNIEKNNGIVEVSDVRGPIFHLLLSAIYGLKIEITTENVFDLMYAAHKYQCKDVIDMIEKHVCKIGINSENVLKYFENALLFSSSYIQKACVKFIQENTMAVLENPEIFTIQPETINKIFKLNELNIESETCLIDVLQCYIKKHQSDPEIEGKIRPALSAIRFLTVQPWVIKTTTLLNDEERSAFLKLIATDRFSFLALKYPDGLSKSYEKRGTSIKKSQSANISNIFGSSSNRPIPQNPPPVVNFPFSSNNFSFH
uniref:CSON001176 protein n=1 Tax=Culicoides sonorensis TaxID=179676 RepID=A0A336LVL1_CULSO